MRCHPREKVEDILRSKLEVVMLTAEQLESLMVMRIEYDEVVFLLICQKYWAGQSAGPRGSISAEPRAAAAQ